MGFWDICLPVFAAYVVGSILLQAANTVFGMWWVKKQQKKYEEQFIAKMAEAGVDVSPEMFEQMAAMDAMGAALPQGAVHAAPQPHPTVSGSEGHGQYL